MKHLTRLTALFASCLLLSSMCVPAAVSAEDEPAIDNYSYGDVNLDEKIDVSDAVLLARYAAEDRTAAITSRGKQLADVNRDGDLTSDDTLQILEYISKKRAVLGTEQPPQPVGKTICLTENISAEDAAGKSADAAFISSQLGFAANLLRETDLDDSANRQENEKQKNLLISPLSVSLALGMTANGAKGETLSEMEKVLGGDLDMENLNAYYADYIKNLTAENAAKLHIANSIWARDDAARLIVPDAFLKTTKSYYNADFFKAPFDQTTVEDINGWVNTNTKEMIPSLINNITNEEIMYLINAVAFDAEWQTKYQSYNVNPGDFTCEDGQQVAVKYMNGVEATYLDDGKATGFIKPYKGGKFSFAAVLPNEGTTVSEYIKDLDGEALGKLLGSASEDTVLTLMPKFKFEYKKKLKDTLQTMGLKKAFEPGIADLTNLNTIPDSYISEVLHKTFIEVDEEGTRAAAVTAVPIAGNCGPLERKEVFLTRPFLFMILNNETNLPIFMGYVMDPTQQ